MYTLQNVVNAYRDQYRSLTPELTPRLPIALGSEADAYCRTKAIYSLEVEKRGAHFCADDATENKFKRIARWLYQSNKRGLLLVGSVGNGKSTMLRSIHRLFECLGSLGNAQDIFDYFKKQPGEMRYWDEKFLLIDDLGIEPTRCLSYGEEYYPLTKLLLHRYDRCLTTIIATNLTIPQIQERYGDRVADRLHEMYDVITYTNDSYRRKK